MRSLMVVKLVSVPPSQRLLTKNCRARCASSCDDVLRLLLGADEEHVAAARRRSRRRTGRRRSNSLTVFCRSMM